MSENLISKAVIDVKAGLPTVWKALVDPEAIRQYMFGTTVVSGWREGDRIVWKGEWQGKAYEDHGVILQLKPQRLLQYSHFSPLSGRPDRPENYHTVTIELTGAGDGTHVTLTQDKNASEAERAESEKNWGMMLAALKQYVEQ